MRRLTSVVCRSHFARILTAVVVSSAISGSPASGATLYGSLSNFDVVNDTGEVCHGFEIELEGVNPSDIAFTFGAPYIRYGDPTLVSTGTERSFDTPVLLDLVAGRPERPYRRDRFRPAAISVSTRLMVGISTTKRWGASISASR